MADNCRYCGADCEMVSMPPAHTAECPLTTMVFPYEPEFFPFGLRCMFCNAPIGEGESYYAKEQPRPMEATDLDPRTFDLICIGCSALPPGFSGFTGFAG